MSVTDPSGMQGKVVNPIEQREDPLTAAMPTGNGGGAVGGSPRTWIDFFRHLFSGGAGKQSEADAGSPDLIQPMEVVRQAQHVRERTSTLSRNKAQGKAAEEHVAKEVVKEGNTVVGQQVSVRTSKGRRVIDILIRKPNGNLEAVEVKSGSARELLHKLQKTMRWRQKAELWSVRMLPQIYEDKT